MFRRTTQVLVMLLAVAGPVAAQEPASKPDAKLVLQAFEQYEMVRVALAADKLADVAPHAKELAAAIEPVGGTKAAKAAAALVTAKDIEVARKHFADLSTAVVPVFQAAAIPGTTAYMCSMKQSSWIQRRKDVENPYYGKAMLTCGTPIEPKK